MQIVCKCLTGKRIVKTKNLSVMSITYGLFLDTRRAKKNEKYPVKLRVTFERVTQYYQTVFDLTKEDFQKLKMSRLSPELRIVKEQMQEIEVATQRYVNGFESFSFRDFEKSFIYDNHLFRPRKLKAAPDFTASNAFDFSPFFKKFSIFREPPPIMGTLSYSYLEFIKDILREGRISGAVNYHCSYISLKKFRGNVKLCEITVSYLREYEAWLYNQDISRTTVGMYLTPLRAIFNFAIDEGIIKRERSYPFGRRKYIIPASKNIKKALELGDLKKIYYYQCDPANESEQKARDYWLFSYFANGMNMKDVACLKFNNIQDGYIVFERSKTERALRSDPKPITVFITEDMNGIIDRWGSSDRSPNNYIFPIMEKGMNPLRQYEIIQLFVSFINDWMRRILKNLGIDKKGTTYVARHTFSTVLKRSGASTEYIQEALGHTDIKTTENYLDSFGKEVKKEFALRLTSFKDEPLPSQANI